MTVKGKFTDIDESAKIADSAIIWSYVFIGKDVVIEDNVKIGNGCRINSGCIIKKDCNLQDGVILNSDTFVDEGTFISLNVLTTDEKYPTRHTENIKRHPCSIGKKVIIGAGSIINSCRIGHCAVIGSGSNVIKDVGDNEVFYGNPAKIKGSRQSFDEKQLKFLQ